MKKERRSRPRNQGARWDYVGETCPRCGYDVWAPPSRLAWVFGLHEARCVKATPGERVAFRRTKRWPRVAAVVTALAMLALLTAGCSFPAFDVVGLGQGAGHGNDSGHDACQDGNAGFGNDACTPPFNGAVEPAPLPVGLQATLTWDWTIDVDLHVVDVTAGGVVSTGGVTPSHYDCYYLNCKPDTGPLDWGVIGYAPDNPTLALDNVTDELPEVTTLPEPLAGHTYEVYAVYFGAHGDTVYGTPVHAEVWMGGSLYVSDAVLTTQGNAWLAATVAAP